MGVSSIGARSTGETQGERSATDLSTIPTSIGGKGTNLKFKEQLIGFGSNNCHVVIGKQHLVEQYN